MQQLRINGEGQDILGRAGNSGSTGNGEENQQRADQELAHGASPHVFGGSFANQPETGSAESHSPY